MKEKIERIYLAVSQVNYKKNTSLEERRRMLYESLESNGIKRESILDVGDKVARGRCLSVKLLKDRARVNYRCGYGRHNYAPCLEIFLNN